MIREFYADLFKLGSFLGLTFFFCSDVYCMAQDSILITINANNSSLESIFKQIERQTERTVYYSRSTLNGSERISVNMRDVPLPDVMNYILKNKNADWELGNKSIIISQKPDRILKKVTSEGNNVDTTRRIDVKGVVIGPGGSPIPGSTIRVGGTMLGTIADANGKFSLNNVAYNSYLIIRSIGYETEEVEITGNEVLKIVLDLAIRNVAGVEVLSTGYQDIARQKATGSFAQIDNDLLNRKVSTNIFDRITEVTSGLNFNAKRGVNAIQIRGISTLTANQLPLIVVDGFAYDNTGSSFQGVVDYLNNINPNDVESITVLKDAAAASIWGARSGNGVIVINTKKGKFNQKSKIQFVSNISIGERPRLQDMRLMSSAETIQFERSLFERDFYRSAENAGANSSLYTTLIPPLYELLISERDGKISSSQVESLIRRYEHHDVRNDLNEFFLQNSINQQYSINASGGQDNYSYYTSVGYDRNRGERVGDFSKRITLRFSNVFRPVKELEINGYAVYVQTDDRNNGIPIGEFFGAVRPVYNRLVDENGKALPLVWGLRTFFTENTGNPDYLDWQYRPLDELQSNDNALRQVNARLGAGVKYFLLKGLFAEVKGQYERGYAKKNELFNLQSYTARDMINLFVYRDANGLLQYPIPLNGILDSRTTELKVWNVRGQINFNRRFGDYEISMLAGAEMREAESDLDVSRKYGYDVNNGTFNSQIDYISRFPTNPARASSVRISPQNSMSGILSRFRSYYANGIFTFRNKYTFSASVRQDGANLFGVKANSRVVPLWSAGLLWSVSEESFYKAEWLPELRLRFSYGFNGNMINEATAYPTIRHISGPAVISGLYYASVQSPSNPSLQWERVQIYNVGMDFASKGNRISGSLEFYKKNGLDLISAIEVDPTAYVSSSNSSSYIGNGASIKGHGFDLTLNSLNIKSERFSWITSILFNFNSETVTSLGDARLSSTNYGATYVGEGSAILIGKPVYGVYSFRWAGLNPNNGDPMGYVKGAIVPFNTVLASSGGIPNTGPGDMIFHGQTNPRFWGAVRNTFSYGQLSISANILYKVGHYFRRPTINYSTLYSNFNGHHDYTFRWQKPGDERLTSVPSLPMSANSSRDEFYSNSEILVEKADHVRLQDIRINYTLDKRTMKKMPFERMSLYFYANNLGMLWAANNFGVDPEFERTYTGIKPSRTFAIGATIDL